MDRVLPEEAVGCGGPGPPTIHRPLPGRAHPTRHCAAARTRPRPRPPRRPRPSSLSWGDEAYECAGFWVPRPKAQLPARSQPLDTLTAGCSRYLEDQLHRKHPPIPSSQGRLNFSKLAAPPPFPARNGPDASKILVQVTQLPAWLMTLVLRRLEQADVRQLRVSVSPPEPLRSLPAQRFSVAPRGAGSRSRKDVLERCAPRPGALTSENASWAGLSSLGAVARAEGRNSEVSTGVSISRFSRSTV